MQRIAHIVFSVIATLAAPTLFAQSAFPNRPLRIIVPLAAGALSTLSRVPSRRRSVNGWDSPYWSRIDRVRALWSARNSSRAHPLTATPCWRPPTPMPRRRRSSHRPATIPIRIL